MSNHEQDTDLRDSTPNSGGPEGAAGGMGVSSERVGHAGPGQERTDGVLDTSKVTPTDEVEDTPPEQSPGAPEENPVGLEPWAGYPSLDPRSDDS